MACAAAWRGGGRLSLTASVIFRRRDAACCAGGHTTSTRAAAGGGVAAADLQPSWSLRILLALSAPIHGDGGRDAPRRAAANTRDAFVCAAAVRLAQWDPMDGCYGNWAFRGLKGEAARFAIEHELVGTDPPNGPIGPSATGGSSSLELYEARRLYEDAGKSCDALVFCLGFGPPPLPTILARDGERISVAAHEVPGGGLRDASGKRIRGLFGVGLGFSDAEYTSGSGYAEAGFMPFAVRAGEIAEAVALRTPL